CYMKTDLTTTIIIRNIMQNDRLIPSHASAMTKFYFANFLFLCYPGFMKYSTSL
uniref:Uncharacterized protein n=1 Tax=Amphimedon queenslandica TaxID=400682 RepID=A0A1X7VCH5_AMPQE